MVVPKVPRAPKPNAEAIARARPVVASRLIRHAGRPRVPQAPSTRLVAAECRLEGRRRRPGCAGGSRSAPPSRLRRISPPVTPCPWRERVSDVLSSLRDAIARHGRRRLRRLGLRGGPAGRASQGRGPRRPHDRPPGAVPDGRIARPGSYGDRGPRRPPADERIEAVLHCAARSLVGESSKPARYYRENVAGGVALLEAARASGVGASSFSRPPPSTERRRSAHTPRMPHSARSTRMARRSGRSRRRSRWYGQAYGLRSVTSATSTLPARRRSTARSTRPETHLIPNLLPAAEGRPT